MNEFVIDESSNIPLTKENISKIFNGKDLKITLIFKSEFPYTKTLRDSISNIGEFLEFDKLWMNRFVLIIDELNNNSIEYGSKDGEYNKMIINISKTEELFINIEVIDTGNGKEAKKAFEMEELRKTRLVKGFTEHDSIRGRGLFMIITRLVDELYFRDDINGGLVVGIKKTFKLA